MGTFLVFFGKLMSCCGICIEEEEISETLKDGSQNIPDDSISSDFHGSSSVLVWHLPAAISNCNTRSDNDGPINGHSSSAENKKAKVHFPDISIKEVISEESSSACSQLDSLQSHSGISYDDDDDNSPKEILTCPQKTSTEPDSGLVKSKKNTSKKKRKAMKISLLNKQNEQLTGEASTSSHSVPQSSNPATPISSNVNAVSVPSCQELDSGDNRHIMAEYDYLPKVIGSQKTSLLVRQTVTSAVGSKQNGVMMWVAKKESSCTDAHVLTQQSHNLVSDLKTACLVNVSTNAPLKKNTVSGHLRSEFSADIDDQESSYIHHPLDGNNVESQKKCGCSFIE